MGDLEVESRAAWRDWLTRNATGSSGIWVVIYKQGTGRQRVSYEDLVEEALCFGWVDSVVRTIDAARYAQRFTPRKPDSKWSQSNIERVKRLRDAGQMTELGLAAFATHHEHILLPLPTTLPPDLKREFESCKRAWRQFETFPPGYRRTTIGWVASAKKEETRRKRLAKLIDACERGERLEFI
jgi:uncharacterized protein YdeI (YjbR/CyaY-like superfamily)